MKDVKKKKTVDFFPPGRMCLFSEAGVFKRIVSKGLPVDFFQSGGGVGAGGGRCGAQPQGTLRDEETRVTTWNNKIHQLLIKPGGEGGCGRWACAAREHQRRQEGEPHRERM